MNDISNNNNGNKKTKLESQIAKLQAQEQQINQRLKLWETKLKKAHNLANCLETANKFGKQYLNEVLEKEKTKEQPDSWAWEWLIKNQTEFSLKFEAGKEAFTQLILKKIEGQVHYLQNKLDSIQSQISHQERKFARLQARRQGKALLECKLNNELGCLSADQCDNCRVNYSVPESSNQLQGGAY